MTFDQIQREYRRNAVQNASEIGLIVILYDALIRDFRDAIRMMGDVERRSAKLMHALSVLQLLEGALDRENGGQLASSQAKFYRMIRGNIMRAQAASSAEILEQQIAFVLDLREAWQTVESQAGKQPNGTGPSPVVSPSAPPATNQKFSTRG